jgi:hypothetical protein
VGLDENRAGQAEQGFGVGEHADDVGAAFDLMMWNGLVKATACPLLGLVRASAR